MEKSVAEELREIYKELYVPNDIGNGVSRGDIGLAILAREVREASIRIAEAMESQAVSNGLIAEALESLTTPSAGLETKYGASVLDCAKTDGPECLPEINQ